MAFKAMPEDQVVADLEAASDYLAGRGNIDGARIGTIGYCSGGGQVYDWICGRASQIKCAVVYYGSTHVPGDWQADGKPRNRIENGNKLQFPIQMHQGDADRAVSLDAARAMESAFKESGQSVTFFEYSGADHAYEDDTHPNYHKEATEMSWQRSLEFFGSQLGK